MTLEVLDTRGFTSNRTEPATVTAPPNPLLVPVMGVPTYLCPFRSR